MKRVIRKEKKMVGCFIDLELKTAEASAELVKYVVEVDEQPLIEDSFITIGIRKELKEVMKIIEKLTNFKEIDTIRIEMVPIS